MQDLILLTSSETVSLIRDVFLIVFISVATIFGLLLFGYGILALRKLNRLLDRIEHAAENVESVFEVMNGLGGPLRGVRAAGRAGGFAARAVRKIWG